jgi:hypothetical protein
LQLGFSKRFELIEGLGLLFKAEAFNALNTPKFGGPDKDSTKPVVCGNHGYAAGQPGSCEGYGTIGNNQLNFPRQIQFSLKLQF